MEIKLALEQMALLEKETNREILKLLLRGPKDFRSLCRDIKKSRSAVFDCLKDLRGVEMIGRRKIMDENKGRPSFEYYVRNIHIPELTRTNLLDFLDGIDVTSKFITLTEISAIDDLSRYIPVSVESFLNLILYGGVEFKYAIQILIELGSQLESKIEYNLLIEKTAEIIKEKYPIGDETIEKFKERATKEIKALSKNRKIDLGPEITEKIAIKELGIEKFEAKFIVSKILMILRLLGISEIQYTTLINLMYTFAENIGVTCRKTPYFYNVTEFPTLESSKIVVSVKNKKEEWSLINFSDYLLRNKSLEKTKCDFLAHLMIEKLLVLGLKEYDITFIESLSKELMTGFNI